MENLKLLLLKNDTEDAFDVDETDLFCKSLSEKTLTFKRIKSIGDKKDKQRLAVFIAVNTISDKKSALCTFVRLLFVS